MSYLRKAYPDLSDLVITRPAIFYEYEYFPTELFVFDYHADAYRQFTKLVSDAISEANQRLADGDYDFCVVIRLIDDLDLLPDGSFPPSSAFEEISGYLPGSNSEVYADYRDARECADRCINIDIQHLGCDPYVDITTDP